MKLRSLRAAMQSESATASNFSHVFGTVVDMKKKEIQASGLPLWAALSWPPGI